MPRRKTPIISLEEARARFEEWRQNRKGKTSIPDELWSVAIGVARREGMNRAATELRVEWNELKRRMAGPETARQGAALRELISVFSCTPGANARKFGGIDRRYVTIRKFQHDPRPPSE